MWTGQIIPSVIENKIKEIERKKTFRATVTTRSKKDKVRYI
jgi:hypothetical protein